MVNLEVGYSSAQLQDLKASDSTARPGRVLPTGWRLARLGDCGQIGSGITLGRLFPNEETRRVPYLRVANVKDGYLDLTDVSEIDVPERDIEKCRLQYGDLLLTEGGDPDKLGRGMFWEEQLPECIHQNHIFRVRFNSEHVLPQFVAAQVRSPYGKAYFLAHAKQTTGIATINQKVLARFPLLIPPLAEQRAIVRHLERDMAEVARLRAAADRQRAAVAALPGAYLREIFESEEARGWKQCKLADLAIVSGGLQKTPARTPANFHRPYLTVRNVQRGVLDLSHVEQFEVTPEELQRYRLQKGDILIVEGNGSRDQIGRNAIFRDEIENCIHQNHLIRVRVNTSIVSPDFVSYYLNSESGKAQMLKLAETTTGLHTLSVSKIQQLTILLPPLTQQYAILNYFEQHNIEISQLHQHADRQHAAIESLPEALLREVFGGAA